jgi:hypothetical protein
MKANIGSADRVARVVAGCAVLAAGYYFKSWWGLLGLLPILTAIVRFCPAYVPLGMSTCPKGDKQPESSPGGPPK